MSVKRTLSNTTNYIQKFINSAYDEVKAVYDSLTEIIAVANSIDDVINVAAAGDLSTLSDNIAAFLINPTAPIKNPCVVATIANITLANSQTIDGEAVSAPMRVCVKDQTDPIENGVYNVVDAGPWTRATDWDGSIVGDVIEGTVIPVSRGTGNQPSWWMVTTVGTITVGVTGITITRATVIVTASVTLADEAIDTTCYPVFATAATGDQALKTALGVLTYDSATGQLGFTSAIATGNIQANSLTAIAALSAASAGISGELIAGSIDLGGVLKEAQGAVLDDTDIDGGNILTIGTDGNTFDLSGTQQVDAIATIAIGTVMRIVHTSIRTLTYHATNLVLPGGIDITTASGDVSTWYEYAAADWRLINYVKATGKAIIETQPTFVNEAAVQTVFDLTNGGANDLTQAMFDGIPSWVTQIDITISSFSTNGTSRLQVQIGDAGGFEVTGYIGGIGLVTTTIFNTMFAAGFLVLNSMDAAAAIHCVMRLTLHDPATNTWVASINTASHTAGTIIAIGAGSKSLSGTLDRIRLTTDNGTDLFDLGTLGVRWQ